MNRPFDPAWIAEAFVQLLPFLPVTLGIMLGSIALGSILGFGLALIRLKGNRVLKKIAVAWIWVLRSTPSIVLLFVVYYGIPEILAAFGINAHHGQRVIYVLITFSLFCSASFGEIFRSAWLSVDKGQTEAALSVGMRPWQALHRIVLPQATLPALPNIITASINLLKEGSLAWTIGMIDIMGQGTLIIARNYGAHSLEVYTALALVYLLLVILIENLGKLLERRLGRYRSALFQESKHGS